jgi:hypothetical protein
VIVALVLATFVVSRTCQKDNVRITKDQAIATAKGRIDFQPTRTQVRFLRQGLGARPYWVVSMSIPPRGAGLNTQRFRELAVVEVDANTGKVTNVRVQR